MISTLSKQGGRRYPQMRSGWSAHVRLDSVGEVEEAVVRLTARKLHILTNPNPLWHVLTNPNPVWHDLTSQPDFHVLELPE